MDRFDHISAFTEVLWTWFETHKRTLPWRDLTTKNDGQRAYQILVSEIMLQQTQVSRVIPIYKEWLRRFPTARALAQASNKDVLLAWRGMGYNNRALRLRDAARAVQDSFPQGMDELQALPGIGHYTAAAIRNFAFQLPTPCLDTNIRRILHRTFVGAESADGTWRKNDAYLLKLADEVLKEALKDTRFTTADWHAALMDFGSLVCTKTNPKWDICPLTAKGLCKAAYKVKAPTKRKPSTEPGRLVGSRFIPNRIFRGKVIEELRDAERGLSLEELGTNVCLDWSQEHHDWLQQLLKGLVKDQLIAKNRQRYVLAD